MSFQKQIPEEKKFLTVPLEVKKEDIQEDGSFLGYGSLFVKKPDSHGDIVAPGAFLDSIARGGRNRNGIAMLWQHRSDKLPGVWKELTEDKRGLKSVGRLAIETGVGKDAYEIMKLGAGLGTFQLNESIGFSILKSEDDNKNNIRTLTELELWEISLVTFPARTGASVTNVKSIQEARTPRDLENALREAGLSKNAAGLVVKMCKDSPLLREAEAEGTREACVGMLSSILGGLKEVGVSNEYDEKKVIPFRKYPLAGLNTVWNAGKEVKKATVEDLRIMSTWFDANNSNVKAAYKLPHHKATGYTTVWRGVANAMARLLQPRTKIPPTERRGVFNHLAKHYKEFDKPVPEFKSYEQQEWKEIFSENCKEIVFSEIFDDLTKLNS
jgi:HK97 family phage prohead protease